jgi:threonine dehydratase
MPMQASAVTEVTREAIGATEKRIRPYIRRTPVIEIDAAEFGLPPAQLNLKLELLQHSGSFKARGAFANLLTREVPAAGVVAASGGNHGAAVAFAAQKLGKPATIFVPSVASPEKMQRIRGYGAKLVVVGERYADALAASEKWRAETGAMPVHAYDQLETLLGQGTVAFEMAEQAPRADSVLVAVGGGGLIGGMAAWYRNAVRVIGVEPETAPTLTYALHAGKPVDSPAGGIAADSLAPKQVGQLMFPLAQEFVSSVILVTDDEIRKAQSALWQTLRLLAEPGGAAAFAALLSGKYETQDGEKVGLVICGANLELTKMEARQ